MSSKYMKYVSIPTEGKTQKFEIRTVDDITILGYIKWFGRWRKYCFFPEGNTVFDKSCLEDINLFIDSLMIARKLKI